MLTLTAGSLLVGALLGLRFRVFFFVVPAIGATLSLIAAAGVARGHEMGSVLLAMGIAALAMQFGYAAGAVVRFALDTRARDKDTPVHA
jgi:hypothetical protein